MKEPLTRWGLAILLTTAGCTTPLDPNVPSSFDLTGIWVLVSTLSEEAPDADAIRKREDRRVARGRQSDPSASGAFVAEDFPIVAAERLVIEQDRTSMGVQYGDGVYRDFSWGERNRAFWLIRAGWHDDALVIASERGDVEAQEEFVLSNGGRRLRVSVSIRTGGENFEGTRTFERVSR